jgi:hypothetical protein
MWRLVLSRKANNSVSVIRASDRNEMLKHEGLPFPPDNFGKGHGHLTLTVFIFHEIFDEVIEPVARRLLWFLDDVRDDDHIRVIDTELGQHSGHSI